MRKDSDFFVLLIIGSLCFIGITALPVHITVPALEAVNDIPVWYAYHFRKSASLPVKLVGITVDESSLNRISHRWPWKRSVFAEMVEVLNREKAKTIGLDFAFVGESEDPQEDIIFQQALGNSEAPVVIAYIFDAKEANTVMPLDILMEPASVEAGMLNTPKDKDGRIRRLRGFIEAGDRLHFSFSVMLAASFLNEPPFETVRRLSLMPDKTYYIDFHFRPSDITSVSFHEVLNDLDRLKGEHGQDFLKDALVLIYPEAEILRDSYSTPLGKMFGGLLHLNGAVNVISGRLLTSSHWAFPFLAALSFLAIFYILRHFGFWVGLQITLGVSIINLWVAVISTMQGIRMDLSKIFLFVFLFFCAGSLYKYISFWVYLLKIKNKATLDPLRHLLTVRYFYYRAGIETKKIYFHKNLYLVCIRLGSFRNETEKCSFKEIKAMWHQIRDILISGSSFWAAYSHEEIAGCITATHTSVLSDLRIRVERLEKLFLKNNLAVSVKASCVRLKGNHPLQELFMFLCGALKGSEQKVSFIEGGEVSSLKRFPNSSDLPSYSRALDSLDEDLEEKNRQLLSLIDDVIKEHAKTKEAFFQIIKSLVNALEARDPYTQGHSERVAEISLRLADALGWSREEREKLQRAAQLHDLGKIGIPDSILHKKDRLTDEEFEFIKKHEVISVKILEPLKDVRDILSWIMYHHERWDGKGYPHGLSHDSVPEASAIIALADAFDAMTTGRDYKKAISVAEALAEIERNKGTQFHPRLSEVFIRMMSEQTEEKYKNG